MDITVKDKSECGCIKTTRLEVVRVHDDNKSCNDFMVTGQPGLLHLEACGGHLKQIQDQEGE